MNLTPAYWTESSAKGGFRIVLVDQPALTVQVSVEGQQVGPVGAAERRVVDLVRQRRRHPGQGSALREAALRRLLFVASAAVLEPNLGTRQRLVHFPGASEQTLDFMSDNNLLIFSVFILTLLNIFNIISIFSSFCLVCKQ